MAQKRMFSKRIINSAKFLKMPISSQALYFHLGLHADDDGIVEAFTVLKYINSSEDDLKVLVSKGFVIILNDDLVAFITDWNEHNMIRADRKIDSIYKNLLLQIAPDVKLLESKPRADTKTETKYHKDTGRPLDNQRTAQVSIGKVSIGQNSIGQDSLDNIPVSKETVINKKTIHDDILNYWNKKGIIEHKRIDDKTKRTIDILLKDYTDSDIKQSIDNYDAIIRSKEYFFDYKWSLGDFLRRGFEKFKDLEIAHNNYRVKSKATEKDDIIKRMLEKARKEDMEAENAKRNSCKITSTIV